jgi:hypothetical protein
MSKAIIIFERIQLVIRVLTLILSYGIIALWIFVAVKWDDPDGARESYLDARALRDVNLWFGIPLVCVCYSVYLFCRTGMSRYGTDLAITGHFCCWFRYLGDCCALKPRSHPSSTWHPPHARIPQYSMPSVRYGFRIQIPPQRAVLQYSGQRIAFICENV